MAILEINDVRFRYRSRYQQVEALRGVTYSFEQGKVYALVGKSGSGKSTLLSLMAGLDLPQEGEILFEGKPTTAMNLNRFRRERVAMIYQSFRLFPLLTVSENVTYPMELRGFRGKQAREKAQALIQKVNLPETVLNRFPSMLSGGEQQRVAIARALAKNPKLLLCDEPTGALDYLTGKAILKLLQDTGRRTGMTVIIITHNSALTAMADRVIRVKNGTVTSNEVSPDPRPVSEIEW